MGDYVTRQQIAASVGYTPAMQLAAPRDLAAPIAADFREAVKANPNAGNMTGSAEQQQAATEAATRLDTAIDEAESVVNNALDSGGYETPLTTIPGSISWIVRSLAWASLYTTTEIPDNAKLQRDSAQARLREIREGSVTIDSATRQWDTTPKTSSRDQVFTSEVLDSLPSS